MQLIDTLLKSHHSGGSIKFTVVKPKAPMPAPRLLVNYYQVHENQRALRTEL